METGEPAPLSSSELAKQQKSVLAVNGGRTVTDKKEKSNSSFKQKKFHKGTFVALGNDRVRGTAVDVLGRVYVADKDRGLMVFQSNGTFLTLLPVASPISVYYDKPRQSVWVGSSELHFLYEYNVTTWEIIQVKFLIHSVYPLVLNFFFRLQKKIFSLPLLIPDHTE